MSLLPEDLGALADLWSTGRGKLRAQRGSVMSKEQASALKVADMFDQPVESDWLALSSKSLGHPFLSSDEAVSGFALSRGLSFSEQLDQARQEGYRQGYEDGRREVANLMEMERAKLHEELSQRAIQALAQVAGAVEAGRASAVAVALEDAASLAFELTKELVGHELSSAGCSSLNSVRRALALAPPGVELLVRLNPEDAKELEELGVWSELSSLVVDCTIDVRPDPAIERAGCVVEAGACRIDAQIGPALERIRNALMGGCEPLPALGEPS